MKYNLNRLITTYIITNIIYIVIFNYLSFVKIIDYKVFGRSIIFAWIINTLISIIVFIYLRYKKHNYKIGVFDILIALTTTFSLISVIYSIKYKTALFGMETRYEGLFAILYYYSLFYLTRFINKDSKLIPIIIIVYGVFESIYALLQYYNVPIVRTPVTFLGYSYQVGTLANPNFYSSFIVISLSYAIGLFIDNNKPTNNIFLYPTIIILFIGLIIGNTTSTIIGLLSILPIILITCIKRRKIKRVVILSISLILIFFACSHFKLTRLVKDINTNKTEIKELVKGNYNTQIGTKRLEIWRQTLPYIKKYLLHGAGIDNYLYAFGREPIIIDNYYYDKAHNEFLQILITEGIFSLLTYLLLLFIIIKRYFKNNFKKIYLILPVISYLVQSFFNIRVIDVAPFFFIALGLCITDYSFHNLNYYYIKYIKNILDFILSLVLLIVLSPIIIISILLIIIIDHMNPIYTQVRSGKNNKSFRIIKLRTIKNNKITKLGYILRLLSIDELPQLINIIKGDMSIIGPRPWIEEYSKYYNDYQMKRLSVKPGLIGLAQVKGRNNIDIFSKIENDIIYIDNMSFIVDLMILIKSIDSILKKDNINNMDDYIKKEIKSLKNQ